MTLNIISRIQNSLILKRERYKNVVDYYIKDSKTLDCFYDIADGRGKVKWVREDVPLLFGDYWPTRDELRTWIEFEEEALEISIKKVFQKFYYYSKRSITA